MKVHIVRNSKGDIIAISEEKTDVGAVGVVPPNGEEYEERVVEAYPTTHGTWPLSTKNTREEVQNILSSHYF